MSAELLLKVAEVLEQTADIVDAQTATAHEAQKTAHVAAIEDVARLYTEVNGEELDEEARAKLASLDVAALAAMHQVLEKTASTTVARLGRSADRTGEHKQANAGRVSRQEAWDAFGEAIKS